MINAAIDACASYVIVKHTVPKESLFSNSLGTFFEISDSLGTQEYTLGGML